MSEYPYGKAYQLLAAKFAVAAGCKGNQMGILYFLCAHKFDWVTGQTPEVFHAAIAKDMGLSYNAVQEAITALIRAGVIAHEKRGVVWANGAGRANIYRFAVPITPTRKTGSPLPEKQGEPYTENGDHYINPYIKKKGASAHKGNAKRVGGDKVDEATAEELRLFSREHRQFGFDKAMRRRDVRAAKKDE